jgi:hypothetical protein
VSVLVVENGTTCSGAVVAEKVFINTAGKIYQELPNVFLSFIGHAFL